jgi:hypothetical protein
MHSLSSVEQRGQRLRQQHRRQWQEEQQQQQQQQQQAAAGAVGGAADTVDSRFRAAVQQQRAVEQAWVDAQVADSRRRLTKALRTPAGESMLEFEAKLAWVRACVRECVSACARVVPHYYLVNCVQSVLPCQLRASRYYLVNCVPVGTTL